MSDQQQRYIINEKQRELYNQFIEHQQKVAEEQAEAFKQEMRENDEYMKEINRRITEENDLGFRRSASKSSSRH